MSMREASSPTEMTTSTHSPEGHLFGVDTYSDGHISEHVTPVKLDEIDEQAFGAGSSPNTSGDRAFSTTVDYENTPPEIKEKLIREDIDNIYDEQGKDKRGGVTTPKQRRQDPTEKTLHAAPNANLELPKFKTKFPRTPAKREMDENTESELADKLADLGFDRYSLGEEKQAVLERVEHAIYSLPGGHEFPDLNERIEWLIEKIRKPGIIKRESLKLAQERIKSIGTKDTELVIDESTYAKAIQEYLLLDRDEQRQVERVVAIRDGERRGIEVLDGVEDGLVGELAALGLDSIKLNGDLNSVGGPLTRENRLIGPNNHPDVLLSTACQAIAEERVSGLGLEGRELQEAKGKYANALRRLKALSYQQIRVIKDTLDIRSIVQANADHHASEGEAQNIPEDHADTPIDTDPHALTLDSMFAEATPSGPHHRSRRSIFGLLDTNMSHPRHKGKKRPDLHGPIARMLYAPKRKTPEGTTSHKAQKNVENDTESSVEKSEKETRALRLKRVLGAVASAPTQVLSKVQAYQGHRRYNHQEMLGAMTEAQRYEYHNKRSNKAMLTAITVGGIAIVGGALAARYNLFDGSAPQGTGKTFEGNGAGASATDAWNGLLDSPDAHTQDVIPGTKLESKGTESSVLDSLNDLHGKPDTGPQDITLGIELEPKGTDHLSSSEWSGSDTGSGGDAGVDLNDRTIGNQTTATLTRNEMFDGKFGTRRLTPEAQQEMLEFMSNRNVRWGDTVESFSNEFLMDQGIDPTKFELDATKDVLRKDLIASGNADSNGLLSAGDRIKQLR